MTNQKHLSLKQRMLVAATLFGMFFGAGNLIFPVHLGQLAGRNLIPATSRLYSDCSWHSDPWRCRHRKYAFRRSAGSCFPCRETIRLFFYLPALLNHRTLLCHSAMCHNLLYHRDCPDAWRRLQRTHGTVSLFRSVLRSCALLLPAAGKYYTLDWKNHQSAVFVFPGNPDRICPAASGRTGFFHTPGCVVSERCPVPRPL